MTDELPEDAPPVTSLRVEYTQIFLDWSTSGIKYDTGRKPPNPLSDVRATAAVADRVTSELHYMFVQGWSLDGPFDAAVTYEKTGRDAWVRTARLGEFTGAHVKLRRVTG